MITLNETSPLKQMKMNFGPVKTPHIIATEKGCLNYSYRVMADEIGTKTYFASGKLASLGNLDNLRVHLVFFDIVCGIKTCLVVLY